MTMERIENINPNRIQWCLNDSSISLEQLAEDTKISLTSLQKVMASELGLTFNQLKRIGDYFGRGVLFYLETGEVDSAVIRSPQFRTLLNQKHEVDPKIKQIIQLAEWQREVYITLLEEVDQEDILPFSPPDLSHIAIKQAAIKAREWLELDQHASFDDYRQAIEAKGVLVFRTNGYAGKWQVPKENSLLGFSLYYDIYPLIVVRKQNSEARQTFTLAHEFGHLLLHKQSKVYTENDLQFHPQKESAANQFAGYFLVPDELLDQINHHERPDEPGEFNSWLEKYKKAWGVSAEVILRRLLNVGRIERQEYQEYKNWLNVQEFSAALERRGNRAYRYKEPRHILGDTYVRTVIEALHTNRITLTKASKYLDNLKISDLRKLGGYLIGY